MNQEEYICVVRLHTFGTCNFDEILFKKVGLTCFCEREGSVCQVTSEVIYRMSPFWMSANLPSEFLFMLSLSAVAVLLKHSNLTFILEE